MAELSFIEIVLIIILSTGIPTIGVIFLKMKPRTSKSKQIRANESVLNESTSILLAQQRESYESIINGLKAQIKSLTGAVNRYKGIYPEDTQYDEPTNTKKVSSKNLEEDYEIDLSKAIPLLDSFNLPLNIDKSKIPALLQNPLIKGKVWEYIKKNKDEMINLGILVTKGTISQTNQDEGLTEEESNDLMNLEFSQNNAKFMA